MCQDLKHVHQWPQARESLQSVLVIGGQASAAASLQRRLGASPLITHFPECSWYERNWLRLPASGQTTTGHLGTIIGCVRLQIYCADSSFAKSLKSSDDRCLQLPAWHCNAKRQVPWCGSTALPTCLLFPASVRVLQHTAVSRLLSYRPHAGPFVRLPKPHGR